MTFQNIEEMTVKELIERLSGYPQEAVVCYMSDDEGLNEVSAVMVAFPADEESEEIMGEEFVLLQ